MAAMEALLKIRADVQGDGKIDALGKSLGGLNSTAQKVSGGLKGLISSAGGLSGALGALLPAVSGAGLVAMGKSAIDAADNMNDLAQKTGVSVEQLSRFQQAANASGTTIEAVGGAMIKLNRNLANGNEAAAKALQSLGISATDASGRLKSADVVMLEVADRFAKMPDGAQKSAAAIALFGKSGADMIPLLNGGSEAVRSLSATMTTSFAKGADNLNDKIAAIQGKMLQLGVTIGTALMPALNLVADVVGKAAEAMAQMPAPLQAAIGGVVALAAAFVILAPALSAVVSLAGVLAGLQLGATIAGWLGAVGPAVASVTAVLGGLLAWITGTLLPGLLAVFSGPVGWTVLAVAAVVAMAIAFREPIMKFFEWLPGAIGSGLEALWRWGEPIRQFWFNAWENVKAVVGGFFSWLSGAIGSGLEALWRWGEPIRQFWFKAWENVKAVVGGFFSWFGDNLYKLFIEPWVKLGSALLAAASTAWNNVKTEVGRFFSWFGGVLFSVYIKPWQDIGNALANAAQAAWNNVKNAVVGFFNWFSTSLDTYVITPWSRLTERLSAIAKTAWDRIADTFNSNVIKPVQAAWSGTVSFFTTTAAQITNGIKAGWATITDFFRTRVVDPIKALWQGLQTWLQDLVKKAASAVGNAFSGIANGIRSAFQGIVNSVGAVINNVIGMINKLIDGVNNVRATVNLAPISLVPQVKIPAFAAGGFVNGATVGLVGEAGPEYIIPESKMAAASSRFLSGARGSAVIPSGSGGGGGNPGRQPVINITTGPVMEIDNKRYVTIEDYERGIRQTANQIYATLRTPAGRRAVGVA